MQDLSTRMFKQRVKSFNVYNSSCSVPNLVELGNFRFQIIESYSNISVSLLECEDFWIRVLNTGFPFGLNDNISGYGNISLSVSPFGKNKHPYYGIKVPRKPRSHGRKRRRKRVLNNNVLPDLDNIYEQNSQHRLQAFLCK